MNWAGINEDDFQDSLDACNNETERATLITDTLNGLYSEAADNYKEINKDVIKARKSQSEYTDAMAALGEEVEPITNELNDFKTELIKGVTPALKSKVIPQIKDFIKNLKEKGVIDKAANAIEWLSENLLTLGKVTLTAVTVFKTFSAVMKVTTAITAAKTAIAGLTAGVGLATKAQTEWNAVMSANPIGAVLTAVGLLTAGIALLVTSQNNAKTSTDILTESQRQAVTAANEAATAYTEQKNAAAELASAETANVDYVKNNLIPELQNLVTENGNVKQGYEDRASFILGELNSALGTEYENLSDIIDANGQIKQSIYDVIDAKKAQIMLEAYEETYKTAIQNVAQAETARATAAQGVAAAQDEVTQKTTELQKAQEALEESYSKGDSRFELSAQNRVNAAQKALDTAKATYDEQETALNNATTSLESYYADISYYEKASAEALQGNSEAAMIYLKSIGDSYETAESAVKKYGDNAKSVLEQQVIDTEVNARLMKKAYEDGVEGVSEEMVKTAQTQADAAKDEFLKVGGNITKGIAEGAEGEETTKWTLSGAMKRLINKAVTAAQNAMDAHSPSGRFRDQVGKYIGQGIAVGVDDSTSDVVRSVKRQVEAISNAYDTSGIASSVNAGINVGGSTPQKSAGGVVVYQTNNYSQAHSRYELYKSKQATAAAVRLAVQG